jgi:hypothetical protein
MAIGNPTQVGTNGPINTAGQTSIATTSTCVIPANSLVVTVVQTGASITDPGVPTNATDGTNTATVADKTQWTSNAGRVTVYSWFDAAGRTATVTSNFASTNEASIWVFTLASAASSSWLDQANATTSASTTAMAISTLANCAQADEVAMGVYCMGTTDTIQTTWPGAGWTSLANVDEAVRHVRTCIEYINGVSTVAVTTADGTCVTNSLSRVIVTYKGAAAAVAAGHPPTFVPFQAQGRNL